MLGQTKVDWPVYDILGNRIEEDDLVIFAKSHGSGSGCLDIGVVTGFTDTRVNYVIKKVGRDWRGGYKSDTAKVWSNKGYPMWRTFEYNGQREQRYAKAHQLEAFVLSKGAGMQALDDFKADIPDHIFTEESRP